jgi:hypothetical protein
LVITLYGEKYDSAMPGMGNKMIGNVNGIISFHGAPRTPTWTTLSKTAKTGDTTLSLSVPVNWKINDKLIVSISGNNRDEFEERYITAISEDKLTITIDTPLKYNHYSDEMTYDGKKY